ncbi:MAG TPA: type II toxin-antitoxin system VapC family toxin [Thermoanaerobaculia bacterium]|jgi:PIN domain nuclease of toxin-antitoxin system
MRILLDTHCWLWMQVSPQRISAPVLEVLTNPENQLFLSAASCWEIAIKWALGKLPLPSHPTEYVPRALERQGVAGVPVQHRHALHTATLPRHHSDPFDRLLIAQAQLDGLALLTADEKLAAYEGVDLIVAPRGVERRGRR